MTQRSQYIWQWPSGPEFRWDSTAFLSIQGNDIAFKTPKASID